MESGKLWTPKDVPQTRGITDIQHQEEQHKKEINMTGKTIILLWMEEMTEQYQNNRLKQSYKTKIKFQMGMTNKAIR